MSPPVRETRLGEFWLSQRPGRQNWYITWFDCRTRQTRRKNTNTGDREVASRLLAEHYVLCVQLQHEQPAGVSLQVILRRYYQEYAKHLASAEQARYAIQTLEPLVGMLTVADFNRPAQSRLFEKLVAEGRSRSYVSRIFSVAKAAIRRSLDQGELVSIPSFMPLPKAQVRERILSVTELASLFLAAQSQVQMRYLVVAVATGARPGAILELTREQVDLERRRVNFNPPGRQQNKKRRPMLPIGDLLAATLSTVDKGLVISHDGMPYSRDGWRAIFARLVRRAGLAGVSPYTIRHTVATELHRRGVPAAEVAAYMGHSAVSAFGTNGRYVHYQPDFLQQAVAGAETHLQGVLAEVRERLTATGRNPDRSKPVSLLRPPDVLQK